MNNNQLILIKEYALGMHIATLANINSNALRKTFLISSLLVLLTGCHFNNKYQNRPSDLKEAEIVTSVLFDYLTESDFESAKKLFDKEFYKVMSEPELDMLLKSTEKKLGVLKATELDEWNSTVTEGSFDTGSYNLFYKAEFENEDAMLKISLRKNHSGDIRIVGYFIHLKEFLE